MTVLRERIDGSCPYLSENTAIISSPPTLVEEADGGGGEGSSGAGTGIPDAQEGALGGGGGEKCSGLVHGEGGETVFMGC